jgi:peptidyl-prolyl cis-trans isomerase SurA
MNNPQHAIRQLILLLGLLLPQWLLAEQSLDSIVAIVDDDIILQSELQRRDQVIRQQLSERNTQLPDAATFSQQVLDKLILDRIQINKAKENGIQVGDDELNRTLERIASSNGMDLAQFKQQLELEGQTYLEVREQIRSELIINRVQQRLVNQRINISEQEIDNYLSSNQGRAQAEPQLLLRHIMIPLPSGATDQQLLQSRQQADEVHQQLLDGADFTATAIAVSKAPNALEGGELGWRKPSDLPEELTDALLALEPGQFTEPMRLGSGFHILKLEQRKGGKQQLIEQAQVRHILIKPNQIRNEEDSENLIDHLYRRIQAGEDFAALAKQFSDDPGSGSNGGDLGWVMSGQMVPEFEQTMHATATGALSAPFQTQFGWHILQVTERRQQDFGEQILRNEAREAIRKRKFGESLSNWLAEIKAQAYIEIKL